MNQIYKSKHQIISHDPDKSYLYLEFIDEDQSMSKDTFKKEMIVYREAVVDNNISLVLSDSRRSNFIMTPDIQEFIATEVFPYTVQHLSKIAFVMPWNLIQKIAMEQMIEEYEVKDTGRKLISRYFKDFDEAQKWLFSD
ncbi:hypothetical protein HZR84_14215 [Hyphobacterium sp. CCMP332]|nr:hypothetical protein HZR84_14215 [Hyphobacterium sp. CCMP332]